MCGFALPSKTDCRILPKVVFSSTLAQKWIKNDEFSDVGRFRARKNPGLAANAAGPGTGGCAGAGGLAQGPAWTIAGKRCAVAQNTGRRTHAHFPGRTLALVRRHAGRHVCRSVCHRGVRQPAKPARQALALYAEPALSAGDLSVGVAAPRGRGARRHAALADHRVVRSRAGDGDRLAGARHAGALCAQTQAIPRVRRA